VGAIPTLHRPDYISYVSLLDECALAKNILQSKELAAKRARTRLQYRFCKNQATRNSNGKPSSNFRRYG
jgi:hypothetical protein